MPRKAITYRDLRNTPAKVFERLSTGEVLELVSDGSTKAVLIPVGDDDGETVIDAWRRGRALVALARLQASARRSGAAGATSLEIEQEITAARKSRLARQSET